MKHVALGCRPGTWQRPEPCNLSSFSRSLDDINRMMMMMMNLLGPVFTKNRRETVRSFRTCNPCPPVKSAASRNSAKSISSVNFWKIFFGCKTVFFGRKSCFIVEKSNFFKKKFFLYLLIFGWEIDLAKIIRIIQKHRKTVETTWKCAKWTSSGPSNDREPSDRVEKGVWQGLTGSDRPWQALTGFGMFAKARNQPEMG